MKIIKLIAFSILVAALGACATAPGPKFSGVGVTKSGMGDVYLYRTEAFTASGAAFAVTLDGKDVGQLYNASYLQLQLAPGNYLLSVSPGPLTKSSELQVRVEEGKSKFFQYDFVTGPLYNVFFLGSSIQSRESTVALNDLKGLNSAK